MPRRRDVRMLVYPPMEVQRTPHDFSANRQAGAEDPAALAEQLALLKEGAIATAQVRGMPVASRTAKAIAETLIPA